MSGVKVLKVELDHNLAKDFEKVRAYLGIKNDSEVIRFLIREKAREIVTPGTAAEVD